MGEGGQKMSVFVHAQDIKTVHAKGVEGAKKLQNSVHVVVECPLSNLMLRWYLSRKLTYSDWVHFGLLGCFGLYPNFDIFEANLT